MSRDESLGDFLLAPACLVEKFTPRLNLAPGSETLPKELQKILMELGTESTTLLFCSMVTLYNKHFQPLMELPALSCVLTQMVVSPVLVIPDTESLLMVLPVHPSTPAVRIMRVTRTA